MWITKTKRSHISLLVNEERMNTSLASFWTSARFNHAAATTPTIK